MKRLFIAFALLVVMIQGHAQNRLIDSLKVSWAEATELTAKAALLEELCFQFLNSTRQDSLLKYAPQLKTLAIQQNDKRLKALATFYESQSYFRSDSAKLFSLSTESIKLSEGCGECLVINYLGLGLKYRNLVLYKNALENILLGLKIANTGTSRRMKELTASLHVIASVVLHYQGKYSDGLQHAIEALRISEQLLDSYLKQKAYNSLAAIYGELYSPDNNLGTVADRQRYKSLAKFYMLKTYEGSLLVSSKRVSAVAAYNLGLFFSESNQMDSSALYLNQAIRLGNETRYFELLSNAFNVKGGNFSRTQPDSALYFFDQAIQFAVEADFASNQATAMISKASLLQERGRKDDALKLAEQALSVSLKSDVQATQLNAYKLLAELHEQRGNTAKSYEYFKKHITIKDSLISAENFARIEDLKARYDSDLKDSEIQNLSQTAAIQALEISQRNMLVASLVGFIVLAGVGIFLFVRQRNIVQLQKQMDLENRFLRFQLNPHFMSNALVSIQRFLFESNTQQAGEYLTRFARLMRQFLEYSRKDAIALEDEIEVLRNYLDIQKLSFANGFEYEISVDNELDVAADKIPPMFAQPFVENALEHGIKGMSAGKISIVFKKVEAGLLLTVRDNGQGLIQTASASNHNSLATTIIQDRINLLNKTSREKISLSISVPPVGPGTEVRLTLPIYS